MIIDQNRQTRSRHSLCHLVLTPDAFVRTPFPGLRNAAAIIHVAPRAGATFAQYTVEFQEAGLFELTAGRHFLYVLEGEVQIEGHLLKVDEYAYIPSGAGLSASSKKAARAVIIQTPFQHNAGNSQSHDFFVGQERSVQPTPAPDEVGLEVRALIDSASTFDFNVVTLTYQPGATLPRVELSAMDRSILMLSGRGISRLGEEWYQVTAGDFMWIGPGCPQWFGALGRIPTKYLMYQQCNLDFHGA